MFKSLGISKLIWRQASVIFLAIVLAIVFVSSAFAIARGYATDDTSLQVGMVAALSDEGSSTVERATFDNEKRIVGIVTNTENSPVTVASSDAQVFVESDGEVEAYVADIEGDVKQGDLLSLSPLRGVLKRAVATSEPVIAIASQDASSALVQSNYNIDGPSGREDTIIYKLKVNLNRQGVAEANGQQPDSALSKLGRAIVGKDVGEARVIVALIIFIVVMIAEGGIIYGAVSSSITALGRNPMARKAITREMVQVSMVAVVVLLVGVGAMYGILWI